MAQPMMTISEGHHLTCIVQDCADDLHVERDHVSRGEPRNSSGGGPTPAYLMPFEYPSVLLV
jgi:hypothetical protein